MVIIAPLEPAFYPCPESSAAPFPSQKSKRGPFRPLLDFWLARLDNCKNLSDSFQYKSNSLKTKPSSKVKKKSPAGPHPLHIAKKFEKQLEAGSVNKAELARRHGMSRARVTQIMNLLNLESRIKEEILNMPDREQWYFTESFEKSPGFHRLKSKYRRLSI